MKKGHGSKIRIHMLNGTTQKRPAALGILVIQITTVSSVFLDGFEPIILTRKS
jgi:hypothetical protein